MSEELVKRLRTCGSSLSCIKCKWSPDCGGTGEVLRKAADAIEGLLEIEKRYYDLLEKMPRWVSVTERLPEHNTYVIVGNLNGMVREALFVDRDIWLDPLGNYSRCPVTHWMPRPEPPGKK